MNKLLILCSFALVFLTGCLSISGGYTPDVAPASANMNRYDMTYSVECRADGAQIVGRADKKQLSQFIGEILRKANAFGSISYCEFDKKSKYHIHFIYHYSTLNEADAEGFGMALGLTGLAIPMCLDLYLDTTAVVYIDDKPIYSSATSEVLESYYWLPFIVVNLFWNDFLAWTAIEKRTIRYLTNRLVTYQNSL